MAHDGIEKTQLFREIRNLFNEPDPENTAIDPVGIYDDSDERLAELVNLATDEIMEQVPLAERDFLIIGDDRPTPKEWSLPDDCYDIETVEDLEGGQRYPVMRFEDRKYARLGFVWAVSGAGSFGPYVRGNKIGFNNPGLSSGEYRRVFYWAHPGRFGAGFGPSQGTTILGQGSALTVTKQSREVSITNYTGAGQTVATLQGLFNKRQILSVRTTRTITMPATGNPTTTEVAYDHYVIDEILAFNDTTNVITVLLTTDYKKESATGLSYSIGDRITGPNMARTAILYGSLFKLAHIERSLDRVNFFKPFFDEAVDRLKGAWSRWQNQTFDQIEEVF